MKAIVFDQYGPPSSLRYQEVETPEVSDNSVLVRVVAASVNPYDWHQLTGTPYLMRLGSGLRRPGHTILGADLAGRIEAVGRSVCRLRPGDEVFGAASGSLAEFAVVSEESVVAKPANVTFEQAAATPLAALTALQALRDKGHLESGQRVLINGAAGGVGTFAVQIAKTLGATVTAVCSARNVEMVRSIGADEVVDYGRDDFTSASGRYDILLDNVGNRPLAACRRCMKASGVYVVIGGPKGRWLGPMKRFAEALVGFLFTSQTAAPFIAQLRTEDLLTLGEFLESGVVVPVIDRSYPLSETTEALQYLEQGHARGKIIIKP